MTFTLEQIEALALKFYRLDLRFKRLPGEVDLNFFGSDGSGRDYILKIANPLESRENLEFQNRLMEYLAGKDTGLLFQTPQPGMNGDTIFAINAPDGTLRWLRLLTWVEGRCLAEVNPHTPRLLEKVGEMCGKLSAALEGFDHPAAHRSLKWDIARLGWTAAHIDGFRDGDQRALCRYFYELYQKQVVPLLPMLRKSVIYNDANDYNVLVNHDPENPGVPGVIDFGDALYGCTVHDLAIACAYAAMDKPDPLRAIGHLIRGYHRVFALEEQEVDALFALIGARLLISVTCSALNRAEKPENEYLQISDRAAWNLMKQLRAVSPTLARAGFREACGWRPFPARNAFEQWVLSSRALIKPVVSTDLQDACWLDLGVGSLDLGNYADIEDADILHRRILEAMNGKTGIGRYDEVRPFYTSDAYEVRGNDGPEWRTLHIGLDIFMPPETPVMAPIDGIVHSFQDNAQDRDYGPTIILEHRVTENLIFYTLYGHLTRDSLTGLKTGQTIEAGAEFCRIGPMPDNGNWSPHLHFQVMLDMLEKSGDFPGVTFPADRNIWTCLCPDPWFLLFGSYSPPPETFGKQEIRGHRDRHLGKNLSLSYREPLHVQRGWRQYLFDDSGRRFLDTVNNVAHVGHEHPRVVRAGQRQMAVLNTNTRYLNGQIAHFTETLLDTFPHQLEVAYLVNSGSEANELAMRLAKNYTGQNDMIAVEHGYHGNTQSCIDISHYKFNGAGGKGRPAQVKIIPVPDVYRGQFRQDTPETARRYAATLAEAIDNIRKEGRSAAAFICESVISCGGQVCLPAGYLKACVEHIHAAGGLYIADEVQTGCGRNGAYFWEFQAHGVVPDIVTIGKPIGNGHPLGVVVTTRAIADAFANGMEYFNTFGGNPVSCAIGLEVLKVIREEGLQQNALETGRFLSQQLQNLAERFPLIGDVRGSGLFIGVELVRDRETREPATAQTTYLLDRMRDLGVLMSSDGPGHNVLKIKPPLVFSRKDAAFLVEMLDRVLTEDFMDPAFFRP